MPRFIIKENGPMIMIINEDEIAEFIRKMVDSSGFDDREIIAIQTKITCGEQAEHIHNGLPELTTLVSNVENSRRY